MEQNLYGKGVQYDRKPKQTDAEKLAVKASEAQHQLLGNFQDKFIELEASNAELTRQLAEAQAFIARMTEFLRACHDGEMPTKLVHSNVTAFLSTAAPSEALLSAIDAAVAEYKADAARYQFIRNPVQDVALLIDKRTEWVPEDENVSGVGGYWMYEYKAGEELDSAIDDAMNARKETA